MRDPALALVDKGNEVAYLLYPSRGECPFDATRIGDLLRGMGVKPVVIRVSSRHIQVYTRAIHAGIAEEAAKRVFGGPPLAKGPFTDGYSSISQILGVYMSLLEAELFWEAHEVGEELWRLGAPAGQLLSVIAGVYAKAQEGRFPPVELMLSGVLRRLTLSPSSIGVSVDLRCIAAEVARILACGRPEALKCITVPALLLGGGERIA